VASDQVHLTSGSSGANFLVYHTFARGGGIAVETPAYEALHVLAPAVSAQLRTFDRPPGAQYRIDRDALARATSGGVDLIVATDLHNPSGTRLADEDYGLLIAAAEQHDARVLIDEVYLDFDASGRPSAARRHPRIIATNSLTKAHGLGDLRAGWILATPEDIRQLDEQDDLINPAHVISAMQAAADYLPGADAPLARTIAEARACQDIVEEWVARTPQAHWVPPDGGLTGFLLLAQDGKPLDGDRVAQRLMEEHGVRIVPGSFFQVRHALRISFLRERHALQAALASLGTVLAAEAGAS
jgi:aspartate/methionine/tyrosine aminotransferase